MAIAEILFHEIHEADVRKVNAASNDAATGGGARDLRFSVDFVPCLDRLFPAEITYERNTPYRIGRFEYCYQDGRCIVENLRYAFRPTASRSHEVRIAQINKVPFFLDLPKMEEGDGALFMAFIRMTDGLPRAQYFKQRQIEDPNSNRIIASAMREAMANCKKDGTVVFAVQL